MINEEFLHRIVNTFPIVPHSSFFCYVIMIHGRCLVIMIYIGDWYMYVQQ